MEKKRKELQRLNGVYGNIMGSAGVEVIEGRAVLKDKHTVVVDGKEYTSKYICIAVGGTPHMLGVPGTLSTSLHATEQDALSAQPRIHVSTVKSHTFKSHNFRYCYEHPRRSHSMQVWSTASAQTASLS